MNFEIFKSDEFGQVRTIEEDGNVYFCGSDCVKALGYANAPDTLTRHCRYIVKRYIPHPQSDTKTIEMAFIPEGDLYRLVMHSRLPDAEKFEMWVMDEVLPTIRKYGAYMVPDIARRMVNDPEYAQYIAALVCEDKINKLLTTTATCKTDEGYCKWSRDGIMPLINKLTTYYPELTQQKLFRASYKALKEYEGFDVYAERGNFVVHQLQLAVVNDIDIDGLDFNVPFLYMIYCNDDMRVKYAHLLVDFIATEEQRAATASAE